LVAAFCALSSRDGDVLLLLLDASHAVHLLSAPKHGYSSMAASFACPKHIAHLSDHCFFFLQSFCLAVEYLPSAVVISFNVTGLGVDDEAARDATLAAQAANRLLEALTRAALTAFCSGLDTISMPLVPFMSAYVARLRALTKRGQALPAGAQMHIQVGLSHVRS
jgi:hypothetical protein